MSIVSISFIAGSHLIVSKADNAMDDGGAIIYLMVGH